MVTINMYSIFDKKAEVFNTPFAQRNNAEAMRTFADLVNDQKSRINKHPEDYDIYYIGTFEETEGSIKGDNLVLLCNAKDFMNGGNNGSTE